jgi:hypothetical protein
VNDILEHGLMVFSTEVDGLIRSVAKLVPRERLFDMFDWFNPPPLPEFQARLEKELARLREDAQARGWEVE